MPVLTVRYQVRPDALEDLSAGAARLVAALESSAPRDLRYLLGLEPDGVTVTGLMSFDGTDNPLVEVPAARELQRAIGTWAVGGPPSPVPLRVLGAFGFDGTL